MRIEKIRLGNKKVMPFTIPSGIVMTSVTTGARLLREIPEIGIWTTKSIGPEAKDGNREPILYQYAPGCWGNAVGLTNPGAVGFSKELEQARNRGEIPEDKFVLGSIFGKDVNEFVYVTETLEDVVDGFELNLSCPHCDRVGMEKLLKKF
jgi:dihydroorotate dehydrogenase